MEELALRKAWPEMAEANPKHPAASNWGSPGGDDYTGRPVGGGLWVCLGADPCLWPVGSVWAVG